MSLIFTGIVHSLENLKILFIFFFSPEKQLPAVAQKKTAYSDVTEPKQ